MNKKTLPAIAVTIVLMALLALAVVMMVRCGSRPAPKPQPSPVLKPQASPTPEKAATPVVEIPASPRSSITVPKSVDVSKKPSKFEALSQKAQQKQRARTAVDDTRWHWPDETVIIETKPDGEAVYFTIPRGVKAIRRLDPNVPDCHSYPERAQPCSIGSYILSPCYKEVAGSRGKVTQSHHEAESDCASDRLRFMIQP